jgi:acyl dehydratase
MTSTDTDAQADRIHADDLTVGQEIPFGAWTLSEQDIVDYARVWDPLPMHTDAEWAATGPFGGVIASGLQTIAVYQRLIVDALWSNAMGKAGRGFDLKFMAPVRPGTTLTGAARVVEIDARPDRGDALVKLHSRLVDAADGTVVLELQADVIMNLRG